MSKKAKKIKTWLPVFPGFYNTIFEVDETEALNDYNEGREEHGLEPVEDVNWDYAAYHKDIAEQATDFVETELKKLGMVKSITMQKLVSPKFYNFSNDSIDIVVEPITDAIMDYLKINEVAFEAYLKRKYTSCDGFISLHSNNVSDWMTIETLEDSHELGAVLDFICENEDMTDESLYYACESYLMEKVS